MATTGRQAPPGAGRSERDADQSDGAACQADSTDCRGQEAAPGRGEDRILVIEDSESNLALYRDILEEAGYPVSTASGGREGLELFRSVNPALVLCDIHMDGPDGVEIFHIVREEDSSAQVILMTADPSLETATSLFRHGAADFLVKPFSAGRLLGAVENAFLKRKMQQEDDRHRVERLKAKLEASYKDQIKFQKWIAQKHEELLNKQTASLEEALRENERAARETRRLQVELEAERERNRELEAELAAARDRFRRREADLEQELIRNRSKIDSLADRCRELTQSAAGADELARRLESREKELSELRRSHADLKRFAEGLRRELNRKQDRIEELEKDRSPT